MISAVGGTTWNASSRTWMANIRSSNGYSISQRAWSTWSWSCQFASLSRGSCGLSSALMLFYRLCQLVSIGCANFLLSSMLLHFYRLYQFGSIVSVNAFLPSVSSRFYRLRSNCGKTDLRSRVWFIPGLCCLNQQTSNLP
jgi:hypothetical protein